jgi:transcriptional regulator with XRE-family HTH domain
MARLFGEKLRQLRRQHGLTQAALAERLGLASQAHIANLEAGRDAASLDLVIRAAHLFSIPSDYLLRDTLSIEELAPSTITSRATEEGFPRLFGIKLRTLRQQRDLSQAGLAGQLGLARRGYISNLETGRKAPSLDLIIQIADLFDITTDYLLRDAIAAMQDTATREEERDTG